MLFRSRPGDVRGGRMGASRRRSVWRDRWSGRPRCQKPLPARHAPVAATARGSVTDGGDTQRQSTRPPTWPPADCCPPTGGVEARRLSAPPTRVQRRGRGGGGRGGDARARPIAQSPGGRHSRRWGSRVRRGGVRRRMRAPAGRRPRGGGSGRSSRVLRRRGGRPQAAPVGAGAVPPQPLDAAVSRSHHTKQGQTQPVCPRNPSHHRGKRAGRGFCAGVTGPRLRRGGGGSGGRGQAQ